MTGSEDGTVRQFDLREAPRDGGRDDPEATAIIGDAFESLRPCLQPDFVACAGVLHEPGPAPWNTQVIAILYFIAIQPQPCCPICPAWR